MIIMRPYLESFFGSSASPIYMLDANFIHFEYHELRMLKNFHTDPIPAALAITLDGLFHERARRTPEGLAYRYFNESQGIWQDLTWSQMRQEVMRWQEALAHEHLQPGDRIAIMLKNCPQWVMMDQAALGLGLVTVPLYTSDRPDNVAYVLQDSGARLLLTGGAEQWQAIRDTGQPLPELQRILCIRPFAQNDDSRLCPLSSWLPENTANSPAQAHTDPDQLASIIYTSGTTGRPKGVMLSHRNMLENCRSVLQSFDVYREDRFLSFLPLSHTFERTAGYYLPLMAGATVVYARSFQQLQEDLSLAQPTILMSVPRIYERIHAALRAKLEDGPAYAARLFDLAVNVGYSRFEYAQGRGPWSASHLLWPILKRLVADKLTQRLGGHIRLAVSGGAALPPDTARLFIGLGVTVLQGYGLTETSPVISVNRPEDNVPASVGTALAGVETRVGTNGALQVRGPTVMLGYWRNPEATRAIINEEGWLDTGDVVRVDPAGHIFITGRIKEILVLSNGEKVPPAEIEAAIGVDPLFDQIMVVGEGCAYLSALVVINQEQWQLAMQEKGVRAAWPESLQHPDAEGLVLERMTRQMRTFPGYARIRRVALLVDPWTTENGLLTPTLKLKRSAVLERYAEDYRKLYRTKSLFQ
jgi:long-chain acyl-CoA synthetase